jgi:hypothetical protein
LYPGRAGLFLNRDLCENHVEQPPSAVYCRPTLYYIAVNRYPDRLEGIFAEVSNKYAEKLFQPNPGWSGLVANLIKRKYPARPSKWWR